MALIISSIQLALRLSTMQENLRCPVNGQICSKGDCPYNFYLNLEDFEGCTLEVASKAMDDFIHDIKILAQRLDKSPLVNIIKSAALDFIKRKRGDKIDT